MIVVGFWCYAIAVRESREQNLVLGPVGEQLRLRGHLDVEVRPEAGSLRAVLFQTSQVQTRTEMDALLLALGKNTLFRIVRVFHIVPVLESA